MEELRSSCVLAGGRAIRKELSFTLSSTVPSSSLSLSLSSVYRQHLSRNRGRPTLHCTALYYMEKRNAILRDSTLCVFPYRWSPDAHSISSRTHTKRKKKKKRKPPTPPPFSAAPLPFVRSFVWYFFLFCRDFHCFSHEAAEWWWAKKNNCIILSFV